MNADAICKAIILNLVKSGFTKQVTRKKIESTIMETRHCIDDRTISHWLRALQTFGYIGEEKNRTFIIEPSRVMEFTYIVGAGTEKGT